MTLELTPEIGALIQKQLKSGAFSSVEEVRRTGARAAHREEDRPADNRETVRAEMKLFKDDWKKQRLGA
jgi:Arc/MetJ-type ribon-helix-helix transcriptional regulator